MAEARSIPPEEPGGEQGRAPCAVQPHGFMLVCDPATFEIRHASRNCAQFLQERPDFASVPLRGRPAGEILGEAALHDLRNAAARAGSAQGAPGVVLGVRLPGVEGLFDAAIHHHDRRCFIELEPSLDEGRSAADAFDLTRQLVARIGAAESSAKILESGARLIQAALGYDRVMICRFLHNGAGRVEAEARAPHLGGYVGRRFPAAEVSALTRRRYLANPVRMIADAGAELSPLEPLPAEEEPWTDLAFAQLRGAAPAHHAHLRATGAAASLSISLVVEGRLWGLILCRHETPKIAAQPLRMAAELFGRCFALQICAAERREAMEAAAETRARLEAMLAGLDDATPLSVALAGRLGDLAELLGCQGAALWMGGLWSVEGEAPPEEALRSLPDLARAAEESPIWRTQEIGLHPSGRWGRTAGVLAVRLSEASEDRLFFFRDEEAHGVEWGAEWEEPPEAAALRARNGFELWREEVRGRSLPWSETELAVAEALRSWLRDVSLRQVEAEAEERAREEQRRRLVAEELNHRVKNLLALVKSVALQSGAAAETTAQYSAALEGRLEALGRAHDRTLSRSGGSLADLVELGLGLHRTEADPERVRIAGPDLNLDEGAYGALALALHEMTTNAVKYGALSTPEGGVSVSWRLGRLEEGGRLTLDWIERGGPPIAASTAPRRKGFGSRLIRSVLEHDLRGEACMDFAPEGLKARFSIPGGHVLKAETTRKTPAPEPRLAASLQGLSFLVVEDQGLLAMDAEDALLRMGAAQVRLAADAAEALEILRGFAPDAALLDVDLGGASSAPVARALAARGTPFVFMTGYSGQNVLPEDLRHAPVLRKPVNSAEIAHHLHRRIVEARADESSTADEEKPAP